MYRISPVTILPSGPIRRHVIVLTVAIDMLSLKIKLSSCCYKATQMIHIRQIYSRLCRAKLPVCMNV